MKKNRHQRQAQAIASQIPTIAQHHLTATTVLGSLDVSQLPEPAQSLIRDALSFFAYGVADLADRHEKLTGKRLDLSHVDKAFGNDIAPTPVDPEVANV